MNNLEKNSCCGSKLCCPASNHKVSLCICCHNQMLSVIKQLIKLVKQKHPIKITVMLNNGNAYTFDLKEGSTIDDWLLKVPGIKAIPINTIAGVTVLTSEIKEKDHLLLEKLK